jgi:hypothetical protein
MIELIKELKTIPGETLVGYGIFVLIALSIVFEGIVRIVKYARRSPKS